MNLPNVITVGRIAVCPVISYLALSPRRGEPVRRFRPLPGGSLVRTFGTATSHASTAGSRDTGKLLDPIADKLLLASTFIPIFLISRRMDGFSELPWWGTLPVWVIAVVFGRELFVTLFRSYAARRGVVIAAGKSGKQKALLQNSFVAGLLLWYPLQHSADIVEWSGRLWIVLQFLLSAFVAVTLALAVVLTVLSMCDYLWRYRTLITGSE